VSLTAPVKDPRLAGQLLRLRKAAHLSGDNVASKLGWSAAKVSRIERNRTGVQPGDVELLCDLYGADTRTRALLAGIAERAAELGGARRWGGPDGTDLYRAEATTAALWGPAVVPPPLCLPAYAQAAAASVAEITLALPSEADGAGAAARMWGERITARRDPLTIAAVIDATVLRRLVGSPAVMARQVKHLTALAARANVDLRVLDPAVAAPAGPGAFTLLSFGALALSDLAVCDDPVAPRLAEGEAVTYRIARAFRELYARAADPAPALAAAAAYWRDAR
jgi:transcriptional regulator with XRE-family HTH domain